MKEKKSWIMTFRKLPFALILILILLAAVETCFYVAQLFTDLSGGGSLVRDLLFSLFYLTVTVWLISVILGSRYVCRGDTIRIWFGFLPFRRIEIRSIYGILSYPLNEEIFLLYRRKGKNRTHFLCLSYADADAFCRLLTRDHPEIELEIHTRDEEEDD